uniref:BTB domain-containing protein n=1 Tax=Clastoptera arizonana TaxID=38151 RepID=A0A1B6CHP7_9HEMI
MTGSPTSPSGMKYLVQWDEHAGHLANRLGYLLEHQSLVDVTLMCNTHTLKVHRTVLAACSPYFERQLGNHPLIVLKDMKFSVLKALIEFMYCGETSISEENLKPLMDAAKFFEVKGLSTMSKDDLVDKPSPTKQPIDDTRPSSEIITPPFRGRGGRRSGAGRGARRSNFSSKVVTPSSNNRINSSPTAILNASSTPTEPAQILLSLSGNDFDTNVLQTRNRNVRMNSNCRMSKLFSTSNTQSFSQNGPFVSEDSKPKVNFEPRRRGRKKQNNGIGRGKFKESDSQSAVENLKKEMVDFCRKDCSYRTMDSKLNVFNNNVNNTDKSPLLASLLSKAEALAAGKKKIKSEIDNINAVTSQSSTGGQETVLYQFDGESSGVNKYIDALKEAGLPTDLPVYVDQGDGNYITLTEDVLMNVLGNNESFQFQVTEASMEHEDVSEGVVLQDGSILMTGKPIKHNVNGPIVTIGKDSNGIKGPNIFQKPFVVKEMQATKTDEVIDTKTDEVILTKKVVNSPKSVKEFINDALLESLKTSKVTEVDPDAVVLVEVTDDSKVIKYVVSSKEVNTLKLLNEQIMQKKQNKIQIEKVPTPTVDIIGENTKIAEVKLTATNSKKSIVSQVLEYFHKMEENVQNTNESVKESHKEEEEFSIGEEPESNVQMLQCGSQLVELEFVQDGAILDNKQIVDINDVNDDQSKVTDVLELLDIVCEDSSVSNENIESNLVHDVLDVEELNEEVNKKEIDSTEQNVEIDFAMMDNKKDEDDFGSHDLELKEESRLLQSEDAEISIDSECNISVEQALEAMMGVGGHPGQVSTVEKSQDEVKINIRVGFNQKTSSNKEDILEEQESFQFVYSDQKLLKADTEVVIMEPTEELILSTFSVKEEKMDIFEETIKDQEVVPDECIETSIISPTKDVPFAVGLIPSKSPGEQIQNEHHTIKTRTSASVLKVESIKRRNTDESCFPGETLKKHKNVQMQEDLSEHLFIGMEEECVATT